MVTCFGVGGHLSNTHMEKKTYILHSVYTWVFVNKNVIAFDTRIACKDETLCSLRPVWIEGRMRGVEGSRIELVENRLILG